jgi:hypothetical protein
MENPFAWAPPRKTTSLMSFLVLYAKEVRKDKEDVRPTFPTMGKIPWA